MVDRMARDDKKSNAHCLTKHGVVRKLRVAAGARAAEREASGLLRGPGNEFALDERVGSAIADYAL
jgi:hypothetical protein